MSRTTENTRLSNGEYFNLRNWMTENKDAIQDDTYAEIAAKAAAALGITISSSSIATVWRDLGWPPRKQRTTQPDPADLTERVAALEKQNAELLTRIEALERFTQPLGQPAPAPEEKPGRDTDNTGGGLF